LRAWLRERSLRPDARSPYLFLSERGPFTLETVRYYERKGLLPAPPRTTSGYRAFPEDAVMRNRFIKRAQELGFSLREIGELLALKVSPGSTMADVRERAAAKVADIEEKIRALRSMKKTLEGLTAACCGVGAVSDCPILESLSSEGEKYS
jgi:MerR family transcriptional regulator, copper efflux regulator